MWSCVTTPSPNLRSFEKVCKKSFSLGDKRKPAIPKNRQKIFTQYIFFGNSAVAKLELTNSLCQLLFMVGISFKLRLYEKEKMYSEIFVKQTPKVPPPTFLVELEKNLSYLLLGYHFQTRAVKSFFSLMVISFIFIYVFCFCHDFSAYF